MTIDVEAALSTKFPRLARSAPLLHKPAIRFLKHILHEQEINDFLRDNADVGGFDWIDRVFDKLNFSYRVSARDRNNIPASGRVVIIANHPIGSLDGLALLRLVGEVRQDVKIIANDLLAHFSSLSQLLLPVDVFSTATSLRGLRQVTAALEQEQAVIIFPAGEVSRASPQGVRDPVWRGGFLHFALKSAAPVLPVRIRARNSLLFYSASMLYKPISTMLLSDEMFKQQHKVISFDIGELIPHRQLQSDEVDKRQLVRRLRRHVYKLGRPRPAVFATERTVAHPENRQLLQQELRQAQLLGRTRDNIAIYLFDSSPQSVVMKEIGRLRELAFRQVGEGTGKRRDIDSYDQHYRHLVLWDQDALEIAGSYRIGECAQLLQTAGLDGLYTHSLYRFSPAFTELLGQAVELGRSFVSPRYWGKACLDYLWQGIGAYLAHHPEIRYLYGPVSMSADYPPALRDELVWYFQRFYLHSEALAEARHPYQATTETGCFTEKYQGLDRNQAFALLQQSFAASGCRIPVLYKQYTALFAEGGFSILQFSTDPDFADCLDGLCLTDLSLLKPAKRARYITADNAGSS